MDNELKNKLKYLINKGKDLSTLCNELELKDYEVIGLVQLLKDDGELIDYINGEVVKTNKPIQKDYTYKIDKDTKDISLLILSDTHLTNKADRVDILNYVYKKAEDKGIDTVLHVGDLLDGIYTNRPQQIYELRCYGYDNHLDYVLNKYPNIKGMKTYFVGGNHQDTYIRNNGSDIGKAISKQREDMIYLNPDSADVIINKVGIHLHHGSGKPAYSRDYKLQRYVETLPLDKNIRIVLQGHYHYATYMYYMDKHCLQVGSLEDETTYSRSLGLKNELSVWFVDMKTDNKGNIIEFTPTLETFSKRLIRK